MNVINMWLWKRSKKRRLTFFEKAHGMGLIAGDPEYWRQDAASVQEWQDLYNHVKRERMR